MPLPSSASTTGFSRRFTSADRMMWITPDRVFYAGLLGTPTMHPKGAIIVYVAIDGPLRIRQQDGEWETAEVVVMQPYVPCQMACEGRHVLNLVIEPETVDAARLPELLKACGPVHAPEFAAKVRSVHARLVSAGHTLALQPQDFDGLFFDAPLPSRQLDPRIARVLEKMRNDPSVQVAAEVCAAEAKLSFSRFLHLFKAEVGAPFRSVRTWKRARSLLHYVTRNSSLVVVALDIGYPDSTHFSHSIRQTFGLKPKDIFAGSRKLRVIDRAAPAQSLTT